MLTTRCPDCQTTFRITSVVLHKAAGQVRCGQCSTVFSAFVSLTDTLTGPAEFELDSTTTEPVATPSDPLQPDAEPPASPDIIPDEAVDQVLEDMPVPVPWHPEERKPHEEARGWRVAAAFAAIALIAQATHHYRSSLAPVPALGTALERVYAAVGFPIQNNGEPQDFSIVDWVATAQEDASATSGRLDISAGVRNDGNVPLPYPLLSLELKDRWETVISSRVFTPDEYSGTRLSRNARIRPKSTVTAQLQLVDPGPDAYGFEVDICVVVDAAQMRCKADAVFE
jgi:predicted Zn finger-like uncharacterized protein